METNTNNVSVSFNNKMEISEAIRVLGCSYSHLINLVNSKRFKGQKIEGRWFLNSDEIYKAKSTGMIKPRKSAAAKAAQAEAVPALNLVKLSFEIDRAKFDLLNLALASSGPDKTLTKYVAEKIEELHVRVITSLKSVNI